MPFEKSHPALKAIWEKVSVRAPDGKNYLLFKNRKDLEYLYCTGFVDVDRYPLDEWVETFSDSLMPNGAYMVTEEQWMDKVRFHYSGPVGRPFDPMTLREGEWSEEEIRTLIREKILPSVYITADQFEKVIEDVKQGPYYVNGKFLINQAVKADLLTTLNNYASPRRIRELAVVEAGEGSGRTEGKGFVKGPTPSQQAAERLSQIISKGGK